MKIWKYLFLVSILIISLIACSAVKKPAPPTGLKTTGPVFAESYHVEVWSMAHLYGYYVDLRNPYKESKLENLLGNKGSLDFDCQFWQNGKKVTGDYMEYGRLWITKDVMNDGEIIINAHIKSSYFSPFNLEDPKTFWEVRFPVEVRVPNLGSFTLLGLPGNELSSENTQSSEDLPYITAE